MTIDEMIETIRQQNTDSLERLSPAGEAITAALRAGQAMRDAIEVSLPNTTGYAGNVDKPLGTAHGSEAGKAALAWDTAMKGEDI
jgi:hypothetical protein